MFRACLSNCQGVLCLLYLEIIFHSLDFPASELQQAELELCCESFAPASGRNSGPGNIFLWQPRCELFLNSYTDILKVHLVCTGD